uniref:Alternative protein SYT9 n=1 Tax=Homo sapiens TaxID=9606 RepID=L8ECP0_HUMAN|nr:alternative protein SYT9 [Homo sapiens]
MELTGRRKDRYTSSESSHCPSCLVLYKKLYFDGRSKKAIGLCL